MDPFGLFQLLGTLKSWEIFRFSSVKTKNCWFFLAEADFPCLTCLFGYYQIHGDPKTTRGKNFPPIGGLGQRARGKLPRVCRSNCPVPWRTWDGYGQHPVVLILARLTRDLLNLPRFSVDLVGMYWSLRDFDLASLEWENLESALK